MKRLYALLLLLLALLVTGCPSNHYVIDLTPHGKIIERKMLFYCEDGTNENGAPKLDNFPTAELTEITRLYPPGNVTQDGERHTATGEFAGNMPRDVGGAGTYTNVTTSLGSAGFYLERFRGDDDVATRTAKRLQAADRLVDLIIGWSRMELGRERGYEKLRRFLDGDFRRDMKNLSLYGWMLQTSSVLRKDAPEEFAVRFGQYLAERGYFKMEDLPKLFRAMVERDSRPLLAIIQGMVAARLGAPKSGKMPPSLAFLADPDTTWKSWENYLRTTDLYRTRLHQWQKEKIVHEIGLVGARFRGFYNPSSGTNGAAPAAGPTKPVPSEVADEITQELLDIDLFATDDRVTVRLSLPSAPTHSNGKWDEERKQEVWESAIEQEDGKGRVPAFCYANWSTPEETAQKRHFGKVVLSGDDLSQYCLWRGGLDERLGAEWDAFLTGLQPGTGLKEKIEAFRFIGEPVLPATNGPSRIAGPSDFPRQLFGSALTAAEREAGRTNHP